jgi:hypothetical protein
MLFDFSDSEWHFGLDGAIAMANAYPQTPLLLYHWGSVDGPDFPPFNADPDSLPGGRARLGVPRTTVVGLRLRRSRACLFRVLQRRSTG